MEDGSDDFANDTFHTARAEANSLSEEGNSGVLTDEEHGDSLLLDPRATSLISEIEDCISSMDRKIQSSRNIQREFDRHQKSGFALSPSLSRRRPQQPVQGRDSLSRISMTPLDRFTSDGSGEGPRLKKALDDLAGHIRTIYQQQGMVVADRIIHQLATTPLIIKTLLFLEDAEESNFILKHPCIRRILCSPKTVLHGRSNLIGVNLNQEQSVSSWGGQSRNAAEPWIIESLRVFDSPNLAEKLKDKKRIVHYFHIISKLTAVDYIAVCLTQTELDSYELEEYHPGDHFARDFTAEKDKLFESISRMPMLIPLLFTLPNDLIEMATATAVIEHALDFAMERPVMTGQVVLDFLLYAVLLLLVRAIMITDLDNTSTLSSYLLEVFGASAFVFISIRLIGDLIVFSRVSGSAFRHNLLYRWTIVDILAPILIFVALLWRLLSDAKTRTSENYSTLIAVMVGLLWVKALGFLQNANPKLALYIIALFETVQDVWLFLMILLVLVLGFGDVFYTIYIAFRDDTTICPSFETDFWAGQVENFIGSPFCDPRRGQSYLGVYALLVGDVNFNNFNGSKFSSLVFVAASFMGVVMILNMLIAIIVASYKKYVNRARAIFGRSRVGFVAKNILLEEGLRAQGWFGFLFRSLFGLSIFGILGYIAVASWFQAYYFYGEDGNADLREGHDDLKTRQVAVGVMCISIFLMGYSFFLFCTYNGFLNKTNPFVVFSEGLFRCFLGLPATWIARFLLGITTRKDRTKPYQEGESKRLHIEAATFRVEKRIKRLEEAQVAHSIDFDSLIYRLRSMESKLNAKLA